ncbi:hypothetical protein, partial [Caldifermentibacillus hisashii]|uniref:hypothetical protein n=1 Tax=Caldifermentibacillus hisashii TaxID=996558 RepID=UPI001B356EAC
QRPLSPHFSVIPVGKIFFSVFSILWESRNNEHRNYLQNGVSQVFVGNDFCCQKSSANFL